MYSRRLVLWLCLNAIFARKVEGFGFSTSTTIRPHARHPVLSRRSWAPALFPNSSRAADSDMLEEVPKKMPDALNRFFLGPDQGPICVVGVLTVFSAWRLVIQPTIGTTDALAFAASIMLWWLQEHIMHEKLLHSDFDWVGKKIHQDHHDKPYFHISIDRFELILGWLAAAHGVLRLLLPLNLALSATIGYACAGLMYEWAHYLAHTRVKPANEFWKRVKDNHVKHHLVDNRYWFGFSLPAIDDWFGTNPPLHQINEAKRKAL